MYTPYHSIDEDEAPFPQKTSEGLHSHDQFIMLRINILITRSKVIRPQTDKYTPFTKIQNVACQSHVWRNIEMI